MDNVGSQSTQTPATQQSGGASSEGPNVRRKTDIAWRHCTEGINEQNKKILICSYCGKKIAGGGINRMKHHLAGEKGSVDSCKKVSAEVRFLLQTSLKENIEKAKQKKGLSTMGDENQEISSTQVSTKEACSGSASIKRKSQGSEISTFFKVGRSNPTQPSIKACMQSKERWHDTDMSIALWFYDACIPLNAVNSPYFQAAADRMAQIGHGYKVPTYHALRVNLLKDAKTQVKLIVDSFQQDWAEFGCTIMGDGWTDTRQRPLINFLVYCSRGISFARDIALQSSKTMKPDEWWNTFGYDVPNLQKLAIRILSQTASSSGCERNWSVFERIHTKKRNRLEHQRLNDLVYVHYNLRLQNRSKSKTISFDPVDYESIDKTEFWIMEEEQEGELDIDELENMIEEYPKVGEGETVNDFEVNKEDDLMTLDGENDKDDDEDDDIDDDGDEWLNHGRN